MPEHDSEWTAMVRVAELLGVGWSETVRNRVRRAEVDAGARAGTATDQRPVPTLAGYDELLRARA